MSSSQHGFLFDVNFSFGEEGLFSTFSEDGGALPPPPTVNFMITEGGDFMQTESGGNLMILE
jgi:hypothetical protein